MFMLKSEEMYVPGRKRAVIFAGRTLVSGWSAGQILLGGEVDSRM
jgi:hypothetical protein